MKRNNTPGGKKQRKEQISVPKPDFPLTKIEIFDPVTMLLLLHSKEVPVLVQVMSSLAHYAAKSEDCATLLVENGIINYLTNLLKHEDNCVKHYVYRIISHVMFIQAAKNFIVEDKSYFDMFVNSMVNTADVTLQEYSSKILSLLCEDPIVVAHLVDSCTMEMLMKTLSSADPDVQKNTLEIIVQYLKDPKATIGQEFSFKPILQLISSEYPAIQNAACDILLVMTERRKNHNLKELFKTSGGVENLMSVLENFDLKDLHFKVLQIIGNLADTHDDFDSLTPSDIRRLITFITKTTDVADLENAWNSVIKLANTKEGRKVLKEYKILEKMMPMLKADNEKLVSTVCTGLIKFIQDYDTIEDIAEMNPIPALISLLKQEMHWSTKESAIYTIREAIKYNDAMLREVANPQIFVKIQQFTQIPINEIPAEVLKGALECLTLLAEMESFRKLLEPTTVLDIIRILEETLEDSVRVAALNFLNQLVHDKLFSSMMTEGPICIVWETITRNSLSVPTVTAAAHFIETSSRNNSTIAVAFIKCGALHWMLQKKDLKKSPTWKSAINVLLSNHLSAKFAYTARLEFTDVIKEQFYCRREGMSVEKQMAEKFPVYEEILQTADESMKPIYLVNIISDNVELKRKSNSGSIKSAGSKTAVMLPAEDRKNSSAKFSVSNSTISKNIKDEFLAKYIHQVKKLLEAEDQMKQTKIGDNNSALSDNDTKVRAKLIAVFVCNQLSGPDPNFPCTSHYINLHIQQLKTELHSNLIPVGMLRAGLALERALLFKVLADQVGLPCALERGQCSQAWVEVCLPVLSPPPSPYLPTTLLKPSHIVDLLHTPGALLQLGSYAANKYSVSPRLSAYDNIDAQNFLKH